MTTMLSPGIQGIALTPSDLDAANKGTAPYRLWVYVACTLLAVVVNYVLGKDMPSDALHYHLYAGFSALNDRFQLDYFPAGLQSYLNPYAYLPFYFLVALGLPGLAVSTVLAMIHSVILWITYELACTVCPSPDRKERLLFGLCATTLALMNPILLQQIGSSFADVTTGELVLGGWLLLVNAVRRPSMKTVLLSALFLGLATALKPTNAIHVLAAFLLLVFMPLPVLGRIRSFLYFGAALGMSFIFTAAPWSYQLAKMFGNPMFPLLNGVFKSPAFTDAPPLRHYRFVPDSMSDALLRPFAMIDTAPMIHVELSAPDLRYAFLLLVFLIFIISRIWHSTWTVKSAALIYASACSSRTLAALGCGFAADWILWLSGSGNSRYFIPMSCVAAVVAAGLLFRVLDKHKMGRNAIVIALLLAQGVQLYLGAQFRWDDAPWDGHWFNVYIPPRLATEPNLYLTIGMQSNSFIIPYLAKGSGFVNFYGGYALGPDGANAAHVRAMIERSTPHLRVLLSGERVYPDAAAREPRQSDVDDALRVFGLRVDMGDCETISVQGLRPQVASAIGSSIPAVLPAPTLRYRSYLVSCRAVTDERDQSDEIATRRAVDVVLNRLEDACPALFQPSRPQTEHQNKVWLRVYPQTDLAVWISKGEVKFIDPTRGPREVFVGRQEDWAMAPPSLDCGRRHGVYFANVVHASPTPAAAADHDLSR